MKMDDKSNVWIRKWMAVLLAFVVCFSAVLGAVKVDAAKKIKLNRTKVTLTTGKTYQLKVKGTRKKVKWTSNRKKIATVSSKGKVKAKKAGTAKIVAKVSGKKYTCKVIVVSKKKPTSSTPLPDRKAAVTPVPAPVSTQEPTGPIFTETPNVGETPEPTQKVYSFRSDNLLEEHYQKHGVAMGFASKEEYVAAANEVIYSPNALHKLEQEDGDDVYYLEETNEFVIVSTDGYIRTYFYPEDGKAYFDRQ